VDQQDVGLDVASIPLCSWTRRAISAILQNSRLSLDMGGVWEEPSCIIIGALEI
jgi:hypothetical protein